MPLVTKTRPSRATTERELADLKKSVERVKTALKGEYGMSKAILNEFRGSSHYAGKVEGLKIAVELIERELTLWAIEVD